MNVDSDADSDSDPSIDVHECLRLQLAELEMLESAFPDQLKLDDVDAVGDFKRFVGNLDERDRTNVETKLPPNLSYSLTISTDDADSSQPEVVASFHFSSFYPFVAPNVLLRTELEKAKAKALKGAVDDFVEAQPAGELYVLNLREFILETLDGEIGVEEDGDHEVVEEKRQGLGRLWIYSHHIYSMQKRKFIVEWSRELGLTGFSMPGKPGIVCVEGDIKRVDEFWTRLRKLNWKRLATKDRETSPSGSTEEWRKFTDFKEISFDVKTGHGRNYHMDMGKFLSFLQEHDCERMFKMYFGVEGAE